VKQLNKARTRIETNNAAEVATWVGVNLGKTPYYSLVLALAEAIDLSASGTNCYLVVGTTSDKSAVSITLNQGGSKDAIYERSLTDAATECLRWSDSVQAPL